MKKTYKATIKAQTLGRIWTWKNDENSYGMRQTLYIGRQRFNCSLAYIDYRKNFEFMVFDDGGECFCIMGIEDFTKDAFKKYMQEFIKHHLKHGLNI